MDISLQPLLIKGIYLSGKAVNNPSVVTNAIALLDSTEVNTVLLDIKDENGKLLYDSKVPQAVIAGSGKKINDLPGLLKQLHQHKAYVIGRLVLFQDPVLTDLRPEWTLKSKNTGRSSADAAGYNWINPYNQEALGYYLNIAKEAASLGFDEIEFDYDHFPVTGNLADINYGQTSDEASRLKTTGAFCKRHRNNLFHSAFSPASRLLD